MKNTECFRNLSVIPLQGPRYYTLCSYFSICAAGVSAGVFSHRHFEGGKPDDPLIITLTCSAQEDKYTLSQTFRPGWLL